MKKLLLFILSAITLMSCGGSGQLPTDYITFGQAFSHVSQSAEYWAWVVGVGLISAVAGYKLVKGYNDGEVEGKTIGLYGSIMLAANLFVWLMRPCEVAANTTVEQMLRGVYIGY